MSQSKTAITDQIKETFTESPLSTSYKIELVSTFSHSRKEVEQFIKQGYLDNYAATLDALSPLILSVRSNSNDEMVAAFGFSYADQGHLYSESYLEKPIEKVLANCSSTDSNKKSVKRSKVIELSHFSISEHINKLSIICFINKYLNSLNANWLVFTSDVAVTNEFEKLGLELIYLCDANKRAVATASTNWGSYFDSSPRVYCSQISRSFESSSYLSTN